MKSTLRKIAAHCAWTPYGWLRRPILSFDATGLLVEVASCERIDHLPGVEFFSGLLVPGFVNAHCHLELSHLRGAIARGGGFSAFADGMAAARAREGLLSAKEALRRQQECASVWDAKMYREGVVAVGDVCNGQTSFEVKKQSPIHYHNFVERFGLASTSFPTQEQVEAAARACGLSFSRTPHSLYSLQDQSFRESVVRDERSLSNLRSIHFLESRAEARLYQGCGPLHERNARLGLSIDFAHYGSPTARLIASTPPETDLLLVHNTFATQADIEAVEEHFTGRLTWVLSPCSNQYIEGVLPPAALLHRLGVRVALGTDSLASADSLSVVDQIRALADQVPLEVLLHWATLGGAQALGVDAWAGSFEVGKRPGVVLLGGYTDHIARELRVEQIIPMPTGPEGVDKAGR